MYFPEHSLSSTHTSVLSTPKYNTDVRIIPLSKKNQNKKWKQKIELPFLASSAPSPGAERDEASSSNILAEFLLRLTVLAGPGDARRLCLSGDMRSRRGESRSTAAASLHSPRPNSTMITRCDYRGTLVRTEHAARDLTRQRDDHALAPQPDLTLRLSFIII